MNQRGAKLNRKFVRSGMAILFSFLTFFIFFPEDHVASAGRTLVIHNNTNATLFVLNSTRWRRSYPRHVVNDNKWLYDQANKRIPPMSKISLFNFLDRNNNIILFFPKLVRPRLSYRYHAVYVTGKETKPRELYIFPKLWGQKFMSDAPGASE